jgi:hypothetical protein
LGQLRDCDGTERVSATTGKRSEADHEKMETREGNHIDGQLAKIGVELTRETKTGGDTRHNGRHQVVKISVRWVGELESSHADIVESLVVDTKGLIGVFNQLMDGESSIVRLDNGIRDLGGWHNREGSHHTVGEFLTDLGDQERTHTSTSSTSERMGDLETLETVAALSLTTNNIQDLVDKLSTLGIMSLSPVVSSSRLAKDEVVRSEELTERTSTDSIHSTWLQIDEDGTRDILVARSLSHVSKYLDHEIIVTHLIKVDVHALQLKIRRAIVDTRAVKAMLAGDCLPCGMLAALGGNKRLKTYRKRHRFGYHIDRFEDGPEDILSVEISRRKVVGHSGVNSKRVEETTEVARDMEILTISRMLMMV